MFSIASAKMVQAPPGDIVELVNPGNTVESVNPDIPARHRRWNIYLVAKHKDTRYLAYNTVKPEILNTLRELR